jgi:hypothetical protein
MLALGDLSCPHSTPLDHVRRAATGSDGRGVDLTRKFENVKSESRFDHHHHWHPGPLAVNVTAVQCPGQPKGRPGELGALSESDCACFRAAASLDHDQKLDG